MSQSVKNNQDAPLMRLPPEIRCRIWEYVLTGKTLRSVRLDLKGGRTVDWMIPPMSERTHGMDLLRTCRQIYTETALLPYKSNTFTFAYYRMIEIDLRYLKTFQRAEITKIQVQVTDMAGLDIEIINQEKIGSLATVARHRLPGLPALKQIHILLFSEVEMGFDATVCEANIRRQLDVLLAGREIDIVFEVASTSWEWHSLM
jgi:hypothetical protein